MTQTAKLKVPNNFGLPTVAISENGETVVAGSPGATIGTNQFQGAVYVFTKPRSGWRTTKKFSAKLIATDGAPNEPVRYERRRVRQHDRSWSTKCHYWLELLSRGCLCFR
jgi:hypothetical protein